MRRDQLQTNAMGFQGKKVFWFCFKTFYRKSDVLRVKICFALETLMEVFCCCHVGHETWPVFPLLSPPNVFIIASLFKGHHSERKIPEVKCSWKQHVCSSASPPKALKWTTRVCITDIETGKQHSSYKEEGQRTHFPTQFPFLVHVLYTCSSFTKIFFKN